ncbi:MAG: hypothetical protein CMP30_05115 [Roseibacillus sp.]|nr:hypothetical protein [Roseibacillus sp.]HCQ39278.1 hypothetical protein [Verrucomicrobiales bacterium]|tara:strand:- start:822 stop:1241 length:420 start_codon:yes stop_codon:yes gene_type:complete
MQLTPIDRWLRERFIYQTHVYTMRLPESGLSGQVTIEELGESPSRRYRYRLVVNAKRDLESLLTALRSGNQMFATRIVETDPWYRPIIAPKGKSFFFRTFWWTVTAGCIAIALSLTYRINSDEELKAEIGQSLNTLLGK